MLRVSLKGVWAYKIRLALTALAIILGVGLISGVYVYTDTISKAFDGIFANAYAGIDIAISAESDIDFGEGVYIDEDDFALVEGVEGVEQAFPFIQGAGATLLDSEGEVLGTGAGPPTFIASLTPGEAGGFTIDEGDYPAGAGQAALDRASAEAGGFEVGSTFTVISDQAGRMELTLAGIAAFGGGGDLGGSKWILFDLPAAQQVLQRPGLLSGGSVQVAPGASVDEVIARIDALMPDNVIVVSGQDQAEQDAAELQGQLSSFTVFLSVFGWVALFVGSLLIYNTFRIVVGQRTRELALLRALGAGRRQVQGIMLLEAAVIGLIGALLGVGFGVLLALGLQQVLPAIGLELPTASLDIRTRTLVVGMAAGLGVTLVSALVPAYRASRIAVMAALREDAASPPRPGYLRRVLAGSTVLALGLAALLFGLFGDTAAGPSPLVWVGIGVAVIFMGVFVLSPMAARPITNLLGLLFERLTGVSGRLARRNAMRSPRRTAATAAAVMISITLVALASTLTGSIRGTIDDILSNGVDAEVVIQPAGQFAGAGGSGFTPDVAERLGRVDEAADFTRRQSGWGRITSETVDASGASTEVTTDVLITGAQPNLVDFLPPDSSLGSLRPGPGEVMMDQAIADNHGFELGGVVMLEFEQAGEQPFTLAGTAEGGAWAGLVAIPSADWVSRFGVEMDSQIDVKAAAGVSADELKAAVEPLVADLPNVEVLTLADQQSQAESQLNGLLNFILALLALTVLIGMLGVTNTMALSVFERTREIGLLRAVGLTRRTTRRMVRAEASIVSVFGALMGVGLGIFFGWVLIRALSDIGLSVFVIPWLPASASAAGVLGSLVFWLIATGVLGVLFAVFPARRAARLNVIEAISHL